MFRSSLIAAVLCLSGLVAHGTVTLAPLFRPHAVLQRDKPVPVWGTAAPGEAIRIEFRGQKKDTVAGRNGEWRVTLDPMPASAEGAELSVYAHNVIRLPDVLVGDVWICAGQSNMDWTVAKSANARQEIAAANFPTLRQFKVAMAVADAPSSIADGQWEPARPDTVAQFGAVGYFFGRNLHTELGVPIGLINSSWSGTMIEAWVGADALASMSVKSAVKERWQKLVDTYPQRREKYLKAVEQWEKERAQASANGEQFARRRPGPAGGPGGPQMPGGLYNGMVHPLTPFAVRGIVWYQGESNVARPAEYGELFTGLIRQWRHSFQQGDLPFLFVQLPNHAPANDPSQTQWAWLREAQATALKLPEVFMAVTIDLGEADNIHPLKKQPFGNRLAALAKAKVHGQPVPHSGPVFSHAVREGAKMRVHFTSASALRTKGPLTEFVVAGSDRKFLPATARIDGDTIVVESENVLEPVAVRYAWRNFPEVHLFNADGFPAAPFRSDRW